LKTDEVKMKPEWDIIRFLFYFEMTTGWHTHPVVIFFEMWTGWECHPVLIFLPVWTGWVCWGIYGIKKFVLGYRKRVLGCSVVGCRKNLSPFWLVKPQNCFTLRICYWLHCP